MNFLLNYRPRRGVRGGPRPHWGGPLRVRQIGTNLHVSVYGPEQNLILRLYQAPPSISLLNGMGELPRNLKALEIKNKVTQKKDTKKNKEN